MHRAYEYTTGNRLALWSLAAVVALLASTSASAQIGPNFAEGSAIDTDTAMRDTNDGWDVDPQSLFLDDEAGPWAKDLLIPIDIQGTIVDGDEFNVVETITVTPNPDDGAAPWTSWHMIIETEEWSWLGVNEVTLDDAAFGFTSEISDLGDDLIITFDTPIDPSGLPVLGLDAQLAYTGDVAFSDNQVQIQQFGLTEATTAVPAPPAIAGAIGLGMVMFRGRRSRRK